MLEDLCLREDCMCKRIAYHREEGHRLNIIIVAEGAVDKSGKVISSEYVKNVVQTRLKIDTRVTQLGHVQRGGQASAFDRLLGTRLGSEAVLALMLMAESNFPQQPVVMAVNGNQSCYIPLEESVAKTKELAKALQECNYKRVLELRGGNFQVSTYMHTYASENMYKHFIFIEKL